MTDKHQALRDLLARVNGEDTDDCFNAYLEWRKTFDIEHCKALLAERDALKGQLEWTERHALDALKTGSMDMDDWRGDMEHIANSARVALSK